MKPAQSQSLGSAATAVIALMLAGSAFAQSSAPTRIEIRAAPIAAFDSQDKSLRRFGALEFRGGVELTSSNKDFGGISAIRMAPDGTRFIAATDKGRWLRGRIVYDGIAPKGIADAEIAPMLDAAGNRLAARGWYDTEAIAEDGGTLYVAIERVQRIVKFDFGKDGLLARAVPASVPPKIATLPWNKGIEALAIVPKDLPLGGTLIAVSETGNAAGNLSGFLIGGPNAGEFAIKRTDDFDVSDSVILPGGELLLLERRWSLLRGIAVRIRRIALGNIQPGAIVEGAVIFSADLRQQIDNFEGIGVHRAPGGELVVTLVSDDNFSPLQRTLLLQFTLVAP